MKGPIWAALTLGVCFTQPALAEDLFLSGGSIAQTGVPVLDPDSSTARSEFGEPVAPPAPLTEPPVVLELSADEAAIIGTQGKRTDRKWRIVPFGRLKVTADDNLFISHTNEEADVYFTITPGIAAGWGDYAAQIRQLGEFEHYFEPLNLDFEDNPQSFLFAKYNASASFFLENTEENAVDHDALVAGSWEASKLTLGLRLRYQTLSGSDIEVGDRVKRQVYSGAITSTYDFSQKTSLELNVLNSSYDYEDQIDWSEWTLEGYLNYQVLPKTKVALGTRVGTTLIASASDQTFEQLIGRVMYNPSSKLGLSLDGGVEWRQFGEEADNELFTVFNFSATYAPFDGTKISANASRRNYASISLANENVTTTGISARVRQRFLQRVFVTLESGLQNYEYRSIAAGSNVDRTDDTVYVKPSISFDVTKFLSAETAYQFQRNDSSISDNSFTENIVTFQVNFQF